MLFRLRRVRYHYEKNMYRRLRVKNYGGGICFIGHLTITLTDTIVQSTSCRYYRQPVHEAVRCEFLDDILIVVKGRGFIS